MHMRAIARQQYDFALALLQQNSTKSLSTESIHRVDAVVVGAGVIGLACAKLLSEKHLDTLVVEKESHFGTATSSRHSEVIHAGIYYPHASLKARLCVEGKHRLYDYCSHRGVPHRRIGKLVVATSKTQLDGLVALKQAAAANGVTDLELLTASEARSLEPALSCAGALLSPSTGILDSHAYMQALLADAESSGAVLAVNSAVVGGDVSHTTKSLRIQDTISGEGVKVSTQYIINAAGLHAQEVASCLNGFPASCIPARHLAKGNYYSMSQKSPCSRLIYPLPEPGGLGVHLTLDLAGAARFGPDVEWVDDISYEVNTSRLPQFYTAIRQYFPGLKDGALQPAYAGIRPKITGPGESAADFVVQCKSEHGLKGLVNLFGVESPGLTSSLAIAAYAVEKGMEG